MGVSVAIFTLNEKAHLPICLASLTWSDDIVVVDSFSSDESAGICDRAGVRFVQHKFEGFGSQRNWALDNVVFKHEWLLILDADERATAELAAELLQLAAKNQQSVAAYRVRRRFYMWGRWLRYSSLYPTWVVRFIHKDRVRYIDRGHAETEQVDGLVADLHNDLIDENLKGIDEWFGRQNQYSSKEANYELSTGKERIPIRALVSGDPLQRRVLMKRISWKVPLRPVVYFLYTYVFRRGFLDGYDGFVFCVMKSTFQAMILAKKHDAQVSGEERLQILMRASGPPRRPSST